MFGNSLIGTNFMAKHKIAKIWLFKHAQYLESILMKIILKFDFSSIEVHQQFPPPSACPKSPKKKRKKRKKMHYRLKYRLNWFAAIYTLNIILYTFIVIPRSNDNWYWIGELIQSENEYLQKSLHSRLFILLGDWLPAVCQQ